MLQLIWSDNGSEIILKGYSWTRLSAKAQGTKPHTWFYQLQWLRWKIKCALDCLRVQYNTHDNSVVHSSYLCFQVSDAGVTKVIKPGEKGAHTGLLLERCSRAGGMPITQGGKGWGAAMGVNGGPQMHPSTLRKGFPGWHHVLTRYWIVIFCSCFPASRG